MSRYSRIYTFMAIFLIVKPLNAFEVIFGVLYSPIFDIFIFENGPKSTSEAEKSFLEADLGFFGPIFRISGKKKQKTCFPIFFTLISSKMADLAQKMFSSFFGFFDDFSHT